MNRSTNYNFYLPESSDYIAVSQLNYNFETIDTVLGNDARTKTTTLSASNVTSDDYILGLGAGDYQVSGTKSSYLPMRYGTLSIFKSGNSYGYVLANETTTGKMWIRHFTTNEWHESWQELQRAIVTEMVEQSNSESVSANGTKRFDVDLQKTGYTPVGILGITGSGTTGLVLQEYYISNSRYAYIYFRNATSSSITPSKIQVYAMYFKS